MRICETPIALFCLREGQKPSIQSIQGISPEEFPEAASLCQEMVQQNPLFELRDTLKDPRYFDCPWVTGDPKIRFFAGVTLLNPGRHPIGVLCVLDKEPKTLTAGQKKSLEILGRHAVQIHNQNKMIRTLIQKNIELEEKCGEDRQRRLSSQLEKSEEKFRNFFQHAPIGLIEIDDHRKFLESNLEFQKMVGYTDEELRGRDPLDLTHPEDRRTSDAAMTALLKRGLETYGLKSRFLSKSGRSVWVKTFSRKLFSEDPKENRNLVVLEDVTDKVILEEQLKDQQVKLIQSAKMSSLGEMAAGMAHEINNPLAIALATLNHLKRILDSGEGLSVDFKVLQKKIDIAESTLGRISKIVKGLGSFSRNASLDPKEPIRIYTIIEETLSLCQERIRSRKVDLRLDINRDNIVMGRPGQISQVILNLLNNSFDAIEHDPAPWIELKTRTQGNLEVVSVTDSGHGIPKLVRDKIMQPFFTTKELGKGTGLGLSISKGIIEEHGGRFYYDDHSENTRFVIELPILKGITS
jgi:PAS domain S-box-containing protein